jgi:hypothetical protein
MLPYWILNDSEGIRSCMAICMHIAASSGGWSLILLAQANYFRGDADTAINESNQAFQARVNGAPTPSDT